MRQWDQSVESLPWFDRPDALSFLEGGKVGLECGRQPNAQETDELRKWIDEGYFVRERVKDYGAAINVGDAADALFEAETPISDLLISGLTIDGVYHTHTSHEDLLRMPLERRLEIRATSNWRIGQFHLFYDDARKLFESAELAEACSMILGRKAVPRFSLTFSKGSLQLPHEDTCVFHVYPRNNIIGVWVALEDIHPDSGPLRYYPGSHRSPLFPQFDNYPQTNRRTCDAATSLRYDEYMQQQSQRYKEHTFLPKAGAAFFWHGMLIHGGSPISDPTRSRKSFVIHFIGEDCDQGGVVEGPFNW